MQPARVGFGTGTMYLSVNRDAIDPTTRKWTQYSNQDAPSDKTVSVLTFFKPTGEPIAVYVNYAIHPIDGCVLGFISGDFPGAMSRYVEKAFGDNVIVGFTQGASGDQNPLYLRPSNNAMVSRAGNKITGFEINREASEGPLRMLKPEENQTRKVDPKVLDDLFRFMESEGQILGGEVIRLMT
jgi:neutral ceramidase